MVIIMFISLYLKRHMLGIIAAVICILFFALSFWLYHLPLEAVLYPTIICAIIGAIFAAVDFKRAYMHHRQLKNSLRRLDGVDSLPECLSPDDSDYREIISKLYDEMRRSETDAAAKYDDLSNYFTIWAHQIKTPISAMSLILQSEDSTLSRQLSGRLSEIERYVGMVMAYMRLGSESTDYVLRSCQLGDIVSQAIRKFASEFIYRQLKLNLAPIDRMVLTDEKWLLFVIEQVLSNSLKYTPSGSISIYLAGDELCVEVTGIGISPEDLPRIFEKGSTGCNGRTDKRASGIGLYLCRLICTRLGHTIRAESQPDKGTRIYIGLGRVQLGVE